jgi:hypothetical protein
MLWWHFLIGGYCIATCFYGLLERKWILALVNGLLSIGNLVIGGISL